MLEGGGKNTTCQCVGWMERTVNKACGPEMLGGKKKKKKAVGIGERVNSAKRGPKEGVGGLFQGRKSSCRNMRGGSPQEGKNVDG